MHVWFELAHPADPEHTLPDCHHVVAGLDGGLLAKARCWWLAPALGNVTLKNMALPGVGCIRVLDRDHVDASSDQTLN
jgi:hypothetical protein